MRIELVGGMGIGKTTLCNVLKEIGYNCIMEDLGDNPFLAQQYEKGSSFYFPSQMWFAISKFAELASEIKNNEINIIDQAVINCRAYTNLLFKNIEDVSGLNLIDQVFDYINNKFGKPDLLIYLKASPEVQLKRIHTRHRSYELNVDLQYLKDLSIEIDKLVLNEIAVGQNVIEIDTDEIFLSDHHIFAAQLADDIAKHLNFCINPHR